MKKEGVKDLGFYVVVILLVLGSIWLIMELTQPAKISYRSIIQYFRQEKVREFSIEGDTLHLLLADNGIPGEVVCDLYSVEYFREDLWDLIQEQDEKGVFKDYNLDKGFVPPWWLMILPYVLVIGVFFVLWYFMFNRGAGGDNKAMRFGRARTRLGSDEKKKITFADVAGADEEKEELKEIVEFLSHPKRFIDIGARIPKGVLLVGPPGTGKTLIARAVAGEAGVPFLSISGSDFVELYVGVGASRVRDLFEQAKKTSPSIVFIDEIDAVGRHRGAGMGGGHDEREQTLNQLLVEMDGFGNNEGVIVIAATNRPDILDPALLRPGRFDRQVFVGMPDIRGREAILKVHARGKPLDRDVSLENLAKTTPGFTGADLENLLNEAALLAARRSKKVIGNGELQDAMIKVIAGPEKKSKVISEKERRLTAYHEAGHAVVSRNLKTQDPIHHITIIPRGRAGGMTISLPQEDRSYASKSEMSEDIIVFMGGRAAEHLVLDDISTGASNDIERATKLARSMVVKYGMSDKIGPISFASEHEEVFLGRDFAHTRNYSEQVAAQIDEEIKSFIAAAYEKCEEILKANLSMLHKIATYLLEHETMDGDTFRACFEEADPTPA
ncbi:MAG: ATP-dependent zinc metalloprotease FtsH [Oscillospiraceae bacterium]|nr:ATP-dependent zinc metalloprotease FtsH [Oscillospiraceae bacterium]